MIEAWRSVLEISVDMLRDGRTPGGYRFEVCDGAGRLIFDLAFSDVLGGPSTRPTGLNDVLHGRLAATVERSRTLQSEVAAAVANVRATLATTRALLAPRG